MRALHTVQSRVGPEQGRAGGSTELQARISFSQLYMGATHLTQKAGSYWIGLCFHFPEDCSLLEVTLLQGSPAVPQSRWLTLKAVTAVSLEPRTLRKSTYPQVAPEGPR